MTAVGKEKRKKGICYMTAVGIEKRKKLACSMTVVGMEKTDYRYLFQIQFLRLCLQSEGLRFL